MANCPKCGKKLKIYNVSQFCPQCGVNLRFYEFEKNFYREAKYAELSNAAVHVKIRRFKAALIGTKLTILRLVSILFPILGLLVPAATFSLKLPFFSENIPLSALGLYGSFSSGSLMHIIDVKGSEFAGKAYSAFFNALILYGVAVFIAIALILLTVLCFLSVKNMQKIICAVSGIGIIYSIAAFFISGKYIAACEGTPVISGSRGFGFFAIAVAFAAIFIINFVLCKNGIPVEYDEGMEERLEIYRKVKKGEVDLDSLPQPVVETEETRKIDEEIAKERDGLLKQGSASENETPESAEDEVNESEETEDKEDDNIASEEETESEQGKMNGEEEIADGKEED